MSHRRALGALLRLYPPAFRASFGDEMLDVFAVRCEEARRRRGPVGVLAVWLRTLPGLLRGALHERINANTPPLPFPGKRSSLMDSLLQDLRFGTRSLLRSPGIAAVAVLTLALGIGVTTTIFSFVNGLLLRPLPGVEQPSELVVMFTGQYGLTGVSSYMDYRDFAEQNRTLAGFAAYKPRDADLTHAGVTDRVAAMMVTANYFDVLGVQPHLGRFFGPADDDEPGAETVAILAHDTWRTRFAGDPGIIGRSVRVNGLAFDVVGVAPPGFRGTMLESRPQLFVPMMMQPHLMPASGMLLDRRGWAGILTVGRLAEGVSFGRAREDFRRIAGWLAETYPFYAGEREYGLRPLAEATVLPSLRAVAVRVGTLLTAVIALVLAVACVNVANLMLLRARTRRRELAVRQALGAGGSRLARQLLLESLVLAAAGGLAGLATAIGGRAVLNMLPLPLSLDFGLDVRIIAFAAGTTLLVAVGFGVLPALSAARVDPAGPLRGGMAKRAGRRVTAAGALVVAQVALSLVLLVGAGLLVRTLLELGSTELGFDPEKVVVAGVDPSLQGYEGAEVRAFYRRLTENVAAIAGIASVSLADTLPAGGGNSLSFDIAGAAPQGEARYTNVMAVGPGYFETLRIPVLRGRGFAAADDESADRVVVINEAAARQLSRIVPYDPIEARIGFDGPEGRFARIVGVVADSKTQSLRDDPGPMVYRPEAQMGDGWYSMTLVARVEAGQPAPFVRQLRAAVADIDPDVPVFRLGTLEQHLSESLAQERLVAGLVGLAALLALALASLGLYGVMSYAVARRTREIGIRMALGARAGSVRSSVVRQAMALVIAGGLLGVLASLAGASLLTGLLYGVAETDLFTYGAVLALLVASALAASWIPARRATRVDPLIALRSE